MNWYLFFSNQNMNSTTAVAGLPENARESRSCELWKK